MMNLDRVRPKDMPKLREQLERALIEQYESTPGVFKIAPGIHVIKDAAPSTLAVSALKKEAHGFDLYWVSADMGNVCMEAAAKLDDGVPLIPVAFDGENSSGMVYFRDVDVSLGVDDPYADIVDRRVRGFCWTAIKDNHDDGEAILFGTFSGSGIVGFCLMNPDGGEIPSSIASIYPRELLQQESSDPFYRLFATFFHLSQTPTVASVEKRTITGHKIKGQRRRQPPSDVKIVELRQMKHQNVTHSSTGRRYTHRWVVRGHWRDQACGPGLKERRRVWVPAYTKGPADAPLIEKETVFAWRR